MRVTIPHQMSSADAKRKIDSLLSDLASRYSGYIRDVSQYWEGDELVFEFRAKGAKASGRIEVNDCDVIIDGKLPLIAKPFEKRIHDMIQREGERLLCQ